jgi:hypothetical protein
VSGPKSIGVAQCANTVPTQMHNQAFVCFLINSLVLHTTSNTMRPSQQRRVRQAHREVVVYCKDVDSFNEAPQVLDSHSLALRPQALQGTHFAAEGAMGAGPGAETAHH